MRGAASLLMASPSRSFSRASSTAAPWSPTVPVRMISSPGRAAAPDTPGRKTSPTPAVVMKTLSAEPLGTTLVSPVTMATPASAAVCTHGLGNDPARVSISRPSSRMKEADSTRGRAAAVSRSFTVPATANRPMSPPGKNRGSTTKESVVKASRWEPKRTVALSSPTRLGSPYRARKTSSMRAAISRPPAP